MEIRTERALDKPQDDAGAAPHRGPTLASRNRVPISRSGLSDTGISCRTNLAASWSRRWSRSPNGWAGATSIWLRLEPVLLRPAHPTSATATVPGPMRSRTRPTGHVKHSTKLPDQASPPDWRALSVVLNDRAAIYAEEFPAVLADVCRFRGIELAPGAIVVDDVARL
jgi:hypothetical protein